jgi:NAD+ kinase
MFPLRRVGLVERDLPQEGFFESLRDYFERNDAVLVRIPEPIPEESFDRSFDLILAVGGDGTVLRALGKFPQLPVLGINFGTLGFLTAGDQSDLKRLIQRLFAGDFFIEERLVLQTLFRGSSYLAINEMIVKGTMRMIAVDVYIDNNFVHTFRGDGVIVGTPTGSTSYLMSTGSSIVMPTVDCFVLNGINEHRFSGRSIVIKGSSVVLLRINPSTRESDVFLAHDGRDKIPLNPHDEIKVRRHDRPARLVFFDRDYFFRNLKSRLRW